MEQQEAASRGQFLAALEISPLVGPIPKAGVERRKEEEEENKEYPSARGKEKPPLS